MNSSLFLFITLEKFLIAPLGSITVIIQNNVKNVSISFKSPKRKKTNAFNAARRLLLVWKFRLISRQKCTQSLTYDTIRLWIHRSRPTKLPDGFHVAARKRVWPKENHLIVTKLRRWTLQDLKRKNWQKFYDLPTVVEMLIIER